MLFPKIFKVLQPVQIRTLPMVTAPVVGQIQPGVGVQVCGGSELVDGVYWLQVTVYIPMMDETGEQTISSR